MLFDICPFRVVANFGNHGCGKGAENQICIVAWMTMGVVRDIAVKPSRTAPNQDQTTNLKSENCKKVKERIPSLFPSLSGRKCVRFGCLFQTVS